MLQDFELSGTGVMVSIFLLILATMALIWFFKVKYSKINPDALTEKHKHIVREVGARAKYPEVDNFSMSGQFLRYGLLVALAFTLFGLSWTTREEKVAIPEGALDLTEEIEVEPPRTAEPPPPPPPPPPPTIQEVPDEEVIEQPKMETTEVTEETKIEQPKEEVKAPPPPPPPPPPKPKEEEIFKIVEQMPRFPGCENVAGDNKAKDDCAKQKMLEYIYKNVKYPPIARENGVEGTSVIQFVVDTDGTITNITVARDPGAGLGDAAKIVVESMNKMSAKWTPGKQRGRPVRVQYTLPVKFKLEG